MKLLLLIISLYATTSWAKPISLKEAVAKCNSYTPETRAKSLLCKKVDEKLQQLKAKKSSSNSALDKQTKIKNKCEQLGNEKMIKYGVCRPYLNLEPDPILGKSKLEDARYSLGLGYSLLGNLNGAEVELERRTNHFGWGLFFAQQTISDLEENKVTGNAYGLLMKYHFTHLEYAKKHMDFALFSHLGMAQYTSELQGTLPSYIYINVGMEASKALNSSFSLYGKVGVVHIYHSESDFLNMGATGSLGINFGF